MSNEEGEIDAADIDNVTEITKNVLNSACGPDVEEGTSCASIESDLGVAASAIVSIPTEGEVPEIGFSAPATDFTIKIAAPTEDAPVTEATTDKRRRL